MVAAALLCVMLLGAWAYKISNVRDQRYVDKGRGSTTSGSWDRSEFVVAGRITGLKDCRWSDSDAGTCVGASAPLGREYALASGLMEITYASGAKVVLEGPCAYKVESSAGGYLARGKLTARISHRLSAVGGQQSGFSPLSSLPAPLFAVRTPTAIVADLGTEFGVEVDENGDTTSHVFEGKVAVKAGTREVRLAAGESARIEYDAEKGVVVGRGTAAFDKFTRRMPHQGPIKVYGTGQHCDCGVPDPNWYIASALNDPNFKPQHAVTTAVWSKAYLKSRPERAVWISTGNMLPRLPDGVVYTFRTRFQLNGSPPRGLELRGAFAVDNHVAAIRLNGNQVAVPEHGYDSPFLDSHPFSVTDGFVEGTNVLEFDVSNGISSKEMKQSWMALYVEIEAIVRPETEPQDASHKPKTPSDGGKEGAR
ncbi:MAG: hypothetical protein JW959_14295 [Pirellulales bacterium]|nr:hypothetical protein [Pirellulales bacterium]